MVKQLLRYGELAPPTCYIFADRKLVYISVPKVACTAIKLTMGRAYQIQVADEMDIHEHKAWYYSLGKPPKGDYTIFSFVRNPYARLVSCYRDKVIDAGHKHAVTHFENESKLYPYHIPANSTFAEFVKIISKVPDRLADNHFKSQYAILAKRAKALPDIIGHLETIGQDWAKLADRYDFEPHLPHANVTASAAGHGHYSSYYTPELVDLVYQRYKLDFERLGYAHARAELLAIVTREERNSMS